jgi:uncharacterized protein involved in exopolysaccharide biosynthesis
MSVAEPAGEAPLCEFLAHAYLRRRGAAAILVSVFAAALVLAAMIAPEFRAMASLAIMPSPEFTVRQDAGSHALSTSALAMDQIMKAETQILESDSLHEETMALLAPPPHGAGASLAGLATLYPDMAPDYTPGMAYRLLRAALHVLTSPWRTEAGTPQDRALDAGLRRFARALDVLPAKDSNVINISFVHRDPVAGAAALNSLLARYAERRRGIYTDPQLAVAQHETDLMAAAVQTANAALTVFKKAHGFSDFGAERELLLKRRSQADQALTDAHVAQAQAEARLAALDGLIRHLPPSLTLFKEDDTDTRLQTLDDSLVDLRGRLTAARAHYRPASRTVSELQAQIRDRMLERQRMTRDRTPSVLRAGRNPALDPLLLDQAHAGADREAARAAGALVRQEIDGLAGALAALDAQETQLAGLLRRKAAADDGFAAASSAVAEQKLAEAEDARRLANIRIIQPARVPRHPTWTKLLICLGGFVGGAMAASAWLIFRFVTRATFYTAAGLAHASGLPVLGIFAGEDVEGMMADA